MRIDYPDLEKAREAISSNFKRHRRGIRYLKRRAGVDCLAEDTTAGEKWSRKRLADRCVASSSVDTQGKVKPIAPRFCAPWCLGNPLHRWTIKAGGGKLSWFGQMRFRINQKGSSRPRVISRSYPFYFIFFLFSPPRGPIPSFPRIRSKRCEKRSFNWTWKCELDNAPLSYLLTPEKWGNPQPANNNIPSHYNEGTSL